MKVERQKRSQHFPLSLSKIVEDDIPITIDDNADLLRQLRPQPFLFMDRPHITWVYSNSNPSCQAPILTQMGYSMVSLLLIFLISAFHQVLGNHEMSPSPSPTPTPSTQPHISPCDGVSDKCVINNYSVTACLTSLGNESYITVLNDGESSLQLDIDVRPATIKLDGSVIIYGHQVKKINLPSHLGGYYSVLVKVGNGECPIQMGAQQPEGSDTGYMTTEYGRYILFAAVLFIGGSWVYLRLVNTRRHLGGIRYQELEMEQRRSSPTIAIRTHDGFDQNWDDEWDEEEAVRSPGIIRARNGGSLKHV